MNLFRNKLILFLLLIPVWGISQYKPMLNEGSAWHHYHWFEGSCNQHLIVENDTTINNIDYKKIANQGDHCYYTNYTFVREDTISKKVYYNYFDTDIMIYDFSLTAGDTIKSTFQYYEFELVLDSISGLLPQYPACILPPEVFIQNPKVFYLTDLKYPNSAQIIWIEGIGNISNPFISYLPWTAGDMGDALLCHFDETGFQDYHYVYCEEPEPCQGPVLINTIDKTEPEINFYPNPFFDKVYLEVSGKENFIKSIEYYNSEGQFIRSENEISSQNINLSGFDSGLIYVIIRTKKGNAITKKLIKR